MIDWYALTWRSRQTKSLARYLPVSLHPALRLRLSRQGKRGGAARLLVKRTKIKSKLQTVATYPVNLHNSAATIRGTTTKKIALKRLANLKVSCALFFFFQASQTASSSSIFVSVFVIVKNRLLSNAARTFPSKLPTPRFANR